MPVCDLQATSADKEISEDLLSTVADLHAAEKDYRVTFREFRYL